MPQIQSLSIVIPTLNEADNIKALIGRIDTALYQKIRYELIFIDDHSTDSTVTSIREIAKDSPSAISVHLKRGMRGKAFSLLEGFSRARYELICMLDADLQYPPEAIPGMVQALAEGNDIIVANRINAESNIIRHGFSRFGRHLYGKWLHDFHCDVQSGLKLFRKEILNHISLSPTSWTF
ncbi:MAG TPA: glycosyltransferase family 2 protein, partial [Candidatus Polarisedimenticolaceae bacterium]|nr:glycosyltransferase family 2 protein [Candidatus Polarisedimenticolaceae bacterium]